MTLRTWAAAAITCSLACAAGKEEEDEPADPFGDADSDTASGSDTASDSDTADSGSGSVLDTATYACSGTAPEVSELSVEAVDGLVSFEGEDLPAIRVRVTAADADGDLDRMTVRLSWDNVLDGAVDGTDGTEVEYTFETAACRAFDQTLIIEFAVDGSRFEYATAYEFAATVEDTGGLSSAAALARGTTPNADGTAD